MIMFGTLALFYGDYCGLFLIFLLLDLSSCWFQLFASDCGELEMKALVGRFARSAPFLLTVTCIVSDHKVHSDQNCIVSKATLHAQASELFLLLLYVDHGHIQHRIYGNVFSKPLLAFPVFREILLMAFMAKQAMTIAQLWVCLVSLVNTTFPCAADTTKGFQRAFGSRQRPNLELLRNSESLHTIREASE